MMKRFALSACLLLALLFCAPSDSHAFFIYRNCPATGGGSSGPANVQVAFRKSQAYFAPAVITFPAATAANNLIVVGVGGSNGGGGGAPATVSDDAAGGSNVYVSGATVSDASNNGPWQFLQLWYATSAKSATNITITFAGGFTFNSSIAIAEYSGVTTFDSGAHANDTTGTSQNGDSGGFTTANAKELVVGFAGGTSLSTTTDQFAIRYLESGAGMLEDKVSGAAGTYHSTIFVGNAGWIVAGLAFF
jgi:hypothetical protein